MRMFSSVRVGVGQGRVTARWCGCRGVGVSDSVFELSNTRPEGWLAG